jgi:hypothetical protein
MSHGDMKEIEKKGEDIYSIGETVREGKREIKGEDIYSIGETVREGKREINILSVLYEPCIYYFFSSYLCGVRCVGWYLVAIFG